MKFSREAVKFAHKITDLAHALASHRTVAHDIGFISCFTPVGSPESNSIGEPPSRPSNGIIFMSTIALMQNGDGTA